jgi:hypothetical protein
MWVKNDNTLFHDKILNHFVDMASIHMLTILETIYIAQFLSI